MTMQPSGSGPADVNSVAAVNNRDFEGLANNVMEMQAQAAQQKQSGTGRQIFSAMHSTILAHKYGNGEFSTTDYLYNPALRSAHTATMIGQKFPQVGNVAAKVANTVRGAAINRLKPGV